MPKPKWSFVIRQMTTFPMQKRSEFAPVIKRKVNKMNRPRDHPQRAPPQLGGKDN